MSALMRATLGRGCGTRLGSTAAARWLGSTAAAALDAGPLQPFLDAQGCVVGDGGLGTALGADAQTHVLWGAQLLFSSAGHAQIQAVHRQFLEAGADVLTTASYNASYELFTAAGAFDNLPGGAIRKEKSRLRYTHDVLRASVELAKQERYKFWSDEANHTPGRIRPLVAASCGPACETLPFHGAADPSTGGEQMADEAVSAYYARKIESLALARPDLLALETLPSLREARLALAALGEAAPSLPVSVSFICTSGTQTSGGDDFGRCIAETASAAQSAGVSLVAAGLNCTAPRHVPSLLAAAREAAPGVLLQASPSSGELWDAAEDARCWRGDAEPLSGAEAARIRDCGAGVVGGCCRVTPAQIGKFREALLSPE